MNRNFEAFIFDLNGTIIDDMEYHIRAWHKIFNQFGVRLNLEQTKAECYGKNEEVIGRVMPGRFSATEKKMIELKKETQYREEFKPHLKLINGLDQFLVEAKKAGIKMSIGSAAIMDNVSFVLDGLNIRHYFDVIVSADDVINSKPDPETFLTCARKMGVNADNCLVFEDAPKGVEAAINAGMRSVVLTTMHEKNEFKRYDQHILAYGKNYLEFSPEKLLMIAPV